MRGKRKAVGSNVWSTARCRDVELRCSDGQGHITEMTGVCKPKTGEGVKRRLIPSIEKHSAPGPYDQLLTRFSLGRPSQAGTRGQAVPTRMPKWSASGRDL